MIYIIKKSTIFMSLTFKIDLTTNLPKLHLAGGLPLLLLTTEITSTMPAMLGSPTTPGLRLSSLSQWSCQDWHWSITADVTDTGTMSRSEPRMRQPALLQTTHQISRRPMEILQSKLIRSFFQLIPLTQYQHHDGFLVHLYV